MPRSPNQVPTVNVTLSTTPQVHEYLRKLAETGLYGKNAAEAADRLLTRAIEQLIRERAGAMEDYNGKKMFVHREEGKEFAVGFAGRDLIAMGQADLVRRALDGASGASGNARDITTNAEMMNLIRDNAGSTAWVVGQFDAVRRRMRLPNEISTQVPPLRLVSVKANVNGGMKATIRAEAVKKLVASVVNYQERSREIIEEMRAAVLFLWKRFGRRIMVYGHSAGGHLAACMMATDWPKLDPTAPADLIPAGYAISGVFDLTALVHTDMNADFKLDEASAHASSPLFWPAPAGRVLDMAVVAVGPGLRRCGGSNAPGHRAAERVVRPRLRHTRAVLHCHFHRMHVRGELTLPGRQRAGPNALQDQREHRPFTELTGVDEVAIGRRLHQRG